MTNYADKKRKNDKKKISVPLKNSKKKSEKNRLNRVKKIVGGVATGILTAVFVAVIVMLTTLFIQIEKKKQPSVFGYRFYVVISGSMSPALKKGDVIIGKIADDETEYETSDVITYTAPGPVPEKGMIITHRIVEGPHKDEKTGETVVTTRGDANGADDSPVPLPCINAKMVKKSALLTWFHNFITRSNVTFALILTVPVILLLISLIWRLIAAIKSVPADDGAPDGPIAPAITAERKKELEREAIEEYLAGRASSDKPESRSEDNDVQQPPNP